MCQMHFTFLPFARFSPAPASLFSRSRLRGTQGARVYSTAQVWAPTGLSGAFSGRSKSRNLASNHGIGFRPARASQDNGNPHFSFLAPPSHARRTLDSSFPCSCSDGNYLRVWTSLMRMCAVFVLRLRAGVRVSSVHLCWNPHVSFLFFFALLLDPAAVRIITMSSVSHHPSSSQALDFWQLRTV